LRLQKSDPSNSGLLLLANPDLGRFTTTRYTKIAGLRKIMHTQSSGIRPNGAQIFFQPLPRRENTAGNGWIPAFLY